MIDPAPRLASCADRMGRRDMTEQSKLTLRAIEVFIAVVEEGSLATGARRIGASASAVSQQLSNLEAALGAKLIDRAARPLALTPAGHRFQRRALRILDEAGRAQSELAEFGLSNLPQLRLAIIEDFDWDVTPGLVAALGRQIEGCAISVHEGPSHRNLEALENRTEDLVVAADIPVPPDWIERHPILSQPFVLATARGLLDGREDARGALMEAPMVRFSASQLISRQIEAHLRRLRLNPPQRFELETHPAVLAMVAEARGWAMTTPLGALHAERLLDRIDLAPLPFAGMTHTLFLYARRGLFGGLPAEVAATMRRLIAERTLPRLERLSPWAAESVRIIGPLSMEAATDVSPAGAPVRSQALATGMSADREPLPD